MAEDANNVTGEKILFQRGGHQREILVPKSTETMVVVPSNMKGTGFLRNLWW